MQDYHEATRPSPQQTLLKVMTIKHRPTSCSSSLSRTPLTKRKLPHPASYPAKLKELKYSTPSRTRLAKLKKDVEYCMYQGGGWERLRVVREEGLLASFMAGIVINSYHMHMVRTGSCPRVHKNIFEWLSDLVFKCFDVLNAATCFVIFIAYFTVSTFRTGFTTRLHI